ncbi:MAG: flagellar hook-associated protein FlgL [Thermoguttaceae bacterium]|jgi:flagellar hook-associated protein 3 FlgL
MTSFIGGIPTTRISSLYLQNRLVNQIESDQTNMTQLEDQLSTGYQFQTPSQNPTAAMQVIGLQSLIARNGQMQSNIATSQSYLSQTDSALSGVATLLNSVQSTALSATGSTATADQRTAAAQQVDAAIQQLVSTANQQFSGRYLFAGSASNAAPFTTNSDGSITYSGGNAWLSSYSDVNLTFDTNVTGADAFGGMSQPIQGTALQVAATADTRLADLNQGKGVSLGSITISDGQTTSTVDLSGAATLGDVAAMISAHPPQGRSLSVQITATGLQIQLQPQGGAGPVTGNLTVSEVGSGNTAAGLGILQTNTSGLGGGLLTGTALQPILRSTTALADLTTSDGAALDTSGLQITSGGKTYTVNLAGANTIGDVINRINGCGAGVEAEINQHNNGLDIRSLTSGVDFSIGENGGRTAAQLGLRTFTNATQLSTLNHGSGVNLPASGSPAFTITCGDGATFNVDLTDATTVGQVISAINNAAGGNFHAQLATSGNGIELVNNAPQNGPITINALSTSTAAVDLGLIPAGQTSNTSDTAGIIAGADANPQETDGVFNSLLRLSSAIKSNNTTDIQRTLNLLSGNITSLGLVQSELGAREQGLSTINDQLASEKTNLQSLMSTDYDSDMTQVISQLTAQQVAYQATLQIASRTLGMSLINYL